VFHLNTRIKSVTINLFSINMSTTFSLLNLLLFLSLSSCHADVVQFSDHRSLFLVNASASNATDVSPSYEALGYTSDHTSLCSIMIYGTPENTAAGDRDMSLISKLMKLRFNALMNEADASTSLLATRFEVASQTLGMTERRRRGLGETLIDRKLLYVKFNSAYGMLSYACRGCSPDSSDARRILQETLFESRFVEELANDMKEGQSVYLSQALKETNCLRISCDNGEVHETKDCQDIL
jgi:hypothetical protein